MASCFIVLGWEGHVTPTQSKSKRLVGDAVVLREDDRWLVVIPLDKEASCFHGRNTDWCTAKPRRTHWEEHFIDARTVLEQHYGSLAAAVVRVPQMDTMINDLEALVAKYKQS